MRNEFLNSANKALIATIAALVLFLSGSAGLCAEYQHLRFGDPDTGNLGKKYHRLIKRDGYAISYNSSRKIPNWVAWQLSKDWLGSAPRKNNFREDEGLPSGVKGPKLADYRGSGYDRGHMCPSADRTKTEQMNSETFLLTNMIPQEADVNRGPWVKFESWCRGQVDKGKVLYIYAGASGQKEKIGSGVTAPMYCWKVVLIAPKSDTNPAEITKDTEVIAIDMRNVDGVKKDDWRDYVTSVDSIEQVTKLDFFKNVDQGIQNTIESRVYGENLN